MPSDKKRAIAARYDTRVSIKTVPTTKSGSGFDVEGTPITLLNAWASINTKLDDGQSGEEFSAAKDYSQLLHDVALRYRSGVLPTMRVYVNSGPFSGRWFHILAMNVSMRRSQDQLILTCREFSTSGTP